MPSVPYRDPVSALLADPQVPERKRFCGQCGGPVGRAHEGRPARGEGFCPACGTMYSFTPKLHPGDRVAGQYQVAGCIAHGGLGWIYLAQDRNVSDRWVVLKGLLDSRDESAMAAAIAERRFLAEVEHPNIVKIYNFVEHDGAGYIVMEYVGGQSLRETRNQCREETGAPLPVAHAIAYVLEILPAFRFLHRRDLLFCDFKPDNVIQTDEQLKLIDLGGVRARDDEDSDLYGTIGYQGPEVPDAGASVASDLYTLARTLAVLSIDIPGFSDERRHATSLPPVRDVPQFRHYEAFHQFLVKATAPDPAARFQSVDDLEDQLLGVLRQVVAIDGGSPAPAPSTHFSTELGFAADEGTWLNLPIPVVDPFDPAAAMLATVALSAPEQRRLILEASPVRRSSPSGWPGRSSTRGPWRRPTRSSSPTKRVAPAGAPPGGGGCCSWLGTALPTPSSSSPPWPRSSRASSPPSWLWRRRSSAPPVGIRRPRRRRGPRRPRRRRSPTYPTRPGTTDLSRPPTSDAPVPPSACRGCGPGSGTGRAPPPPSSAVRRFPVRTPPRRWPCAGCDVRTWPERRRT